MKFCDFNQENGWVLIHWKALELNMTSNDFITKDGKPGGNRQTKESELMFHCPQKVWETAEYLFYATMELRYREVLRMKI